MKKMVVLLVVVVLLIAAIFAGYKLIRRQILDGPGMEYDPKNYPDEEPIDGLNKEAILDGPDGTSTHAFTGSKDSAEVDLLDIEQMPKTAVRQPDAYFQYAIYINVDKPASGEGEMDDIRSVWLANERSGTVIKVCVTNPMAELQWERMKGRDADGVKVPLTQIAAADKAMFAPGDVSKVIVEGCPDGRNMWTYIIDPYAGTALQLPSTEGVVSLDQEKKEIIAASYGYDDDGRYSIKKAYSLDGKFLRIVGDKERE